MVLEDQKLSSQKANDDDRSGTGTPDRQREYPK